VTRAEACGEADFERGTARGGSREFLRIRVAGTRPNAVVRSGRDGTHSRSAKVSRIF